MVIKNIFSNSKLLWSLVVVGVLIVSLIETLLWRLGSAARGHGDAGPRFEVPVQKPHSMTRVAGSSKSESKASALAPIVAPRSPQHLKPFVDTVVYRSKTTNQPTTRRAEVHAAAPPAPLHRTKLAHLLTIPCF
eukprot:m.289233 g.289233  ORF g.289233 m.289233 type:complete len:134 (-) comp27102_c1_seq14:1107-1508(-)